MLSKMRPFEGVQITVTRADADAWEARVFASGHSKRLCRQRLGKAAKTRLGLGHRKAILRNRTLAGSTEPARAGFSYLCAGSFPL
jgi:hypothetical protein